MSAWKWGRMMGPVSLDPALKVGGRGVNSVIRAKRRSGPKNHQYAKVLCTLDNVGGSIGRDGRAPMVDVDSKIAVLPRILRACALHPLAMAALLLVGSSALAQENRGTEQQRIACAPDVLRLCFWEMPSVDRIVACLRREKSQLSAGCRQVFEPDGRGG
jgi:hypothetical protein